MLVIMTESKMTPAQRTLRAKLAAHASWANTANRSARTEAARKASHDRFEKQVDPDGMLSADERRQRAASARKAFYTSMAYRSAQARRRPSAMSSE